MQKIDVERGDVPRSRYVLRILEKQYTFDGKKVAEGCSLDREFETLGSSEPETIGDQAMDNYTYDLELNNVICEAVGCCAKATDKIEVRAGNQKVISLLLCNHCVPKFQETTQT